MNIKTANSSDQYYSPTNGDGKNIDIQTAEHHKVKWVHGGREFISCFSNKSIFSKNNFVIHTHMCLPFHTYLVHTYIIYMLSLSFCNQRISQLHHKNLSFFFRNQKAIKVHFLYVKDVNHIRNFRAFLKISLNFLYLKSHLLWTLVIDVCLLHIRISKCSNCFQNSQKTSSIFVMYISHIILMMYRKQTTY